MRRSSGGAPWIQILVPERDGFPSGQYQASALMTCWREMGFRVEVVRGLEALEGGADLVLPHLDTTVTPPDWRRVLDGLPNVVNAGLYDISKRRISDNLLGPDDPWDGPVVVKTDRNYAGRPERRLQERSAPFFRRVGRKLARLLAPPGRREMLRDIRAGRYRVLDHLSQVPPWVFATDELVVERFLPQREGDLYVIFYWIFVGDRYRCMKVGATEPIVKAWTPSRRVKEDGHPVPGEVRDVRARLGMDFGKIDFVIDGGRGVVIDVNRTPGGPPPERVRLRSCPLAQGVFAMLDRSHPPVWEREGTPVDGGPRGAAGT